MFLFNLTDAANSTDIDQNTCQETLEHLVQAFQKVMDVQSKVRKKKFRVVVVNWRILIPREELVGLNRPRCQTEPFLFTITLMN